MTTLAVGLAVCEAIRETTGLPAGIKWPNDILIHGRKCAGILCEGVSETVKDTNPVGPDRLAGRGALPLRISDLGSMPDCTEYSPQPQRGIPPLGGGQNKGNDPLQEVAGAKRTPSVAPLREGGGAMRTPSVAPLREGGGAERRGEYTVRRRRTENEDAPALPGVVAGIGINVTTPVNALPSRPLFPATSLALEGASVDAETLLDPVLAAVRRWTAVLESADGPSEVVNRFHECDALRGRRLCVDLPDGRHIEGDNLGISESGALRLQTGSDSVDVLAGSVGLA